MKLYLNRYGSTADPEKVATFEKNIGIALFNKATWAQALEYLEKVLERWQINLPKKNVVGAIGLIWNLFIVLKTLYYPSHKNKPVSNEQDNEIFEIMYKTVLAMTFIDNVRQLFLTMATLRRTTHYDIAQIPSGPIFWAGGAAIFSYSGISYSLANRFLKYHRDLGVSGDTATGIRYAFIAAMTQHHQGNWGEIEHVNYHLIIDQGLRTGDLYNTCLFMFMIGVVKAEQGEFYQLRELIDRLMQIGETYGYGLSTQNARQLKADYLIKTLCATESLNESEEGILCSRGEDTGLFELYFLGFKGEAQILLEDDIASKETITVANALFIKLKFVPPCFAVTFLMARFLTNIHQMQQVIYKKNLNSNMNIQRDAYRSAKAALRNANKYAPYRTKIFRLIGLYYWLIGNQEKAFKWWENAIKEGEHLGARPDLSRTFFEVGKRLFEPGCRYKQLNGIDAWGYIEKAEKLFQEMDLQWDIEQLERVRSAPH